MLISLIFMPDVFTNLRGSDETMSLTGRATGAVGKGEKQKDVYKGNADLAFRMKRLTGGSTLGRAGGREDGPLTLTEGVSLDLGFFNLINSKIDCVGKTFFEKSSLGIRPITLPAQ